VAWQGGGHVFPMSGFSMFLVGKGRCIGRHCVGVGRVLMSGFKVFLVGDGLCVLSVHLGGGAGHVPGDLQ
jgi:hypothetical protein